MSDQRPPQFSLRSLLLVISGVAVVLAFAIRFPSAMLVLAAIAIVIVAVLLIFALIIGEAMFCDWLSSDRDRDERGQSDDNC